MRSSLFKRLKEDLCDGYICCIGFNELMLENVRSVIDSDDVFISLKLPEGIVSIYGNSLVIEEKQSSTIYITGKIENIEFEVRKWDWNQNF